MNIRCISRSMLSLRLLLMAGLALCAPPGNTKRAFAGKALPHRVFASSRMDVDAVLARPYDADVPFGSSGEIAWATSPQGWAFRDGVHLLYISDRDGAGLFDVNIRSGDNRYIVDKAEYAPSHVHLAGAPGSLLTATASYTYITDNPQNPLSKPFSPAKRWTCWNSKHRTDTYTVDFGKSRRLWGCDLYFFSDVEQGGGCAPPESVRVELFRNDSWHDAPTRPITPRLGRTNIAFSGIAPEQAEQIRFTFRNRGTDLYTGLYGVEPAFAEQGAGEEGTNRQTRERNEKEGERKKEKGESDATQSSIVNRQSSIPSTLSVVADKWITEEDVLVTRLVVRNTTQNTQPLAVRMDSPLNSGEHGFAEQRDVAGYPVYLASSGTDGKTRDTHFLTDIKPGETRRYTFACAVGRSQLEADGKLKAALALRDPLKTQEAAYQRWFDANTAYFACSDPLVSKMAAHRWYNVKKNSMYPRLGRLSHRAFAEGRWTADWYANVISYGAGHQVDEARWLRDPSYAWGHVQTWAENPRPDGIFPSHVTPKGQQGGQYTDWIGSTAWDAYLVHPDKKRLEAVADPVAQNALAWRKVYGWNDSPLLVVDSHWWTGMEWQPSFFAFADYKTGGGSGEDRRYMTPLRRVDLTAYNYANAQNAASIYRELGRTEDAQRLQKLAEETREAALTQMWNPKTQWFHSLRASDNAIDPAKEIIGVYPFTFDLPTKEKGYEAVWNVALDPAQFWTVWPLASASKDCPAYAQNGWPVGPGGSGCMWNGPSWPHANSLVMTAMANTLRHYRSGTLTRQNLLDLFLSFTRVQYKGQNPTYPWTGEYYNGDTGEWKTPQRDYNHSTWADPLIRHLIGLVPRSDNMLEVDPLLPPGAWSYYVLDGQAYHGHDVTIAWDETGGHVAPNFKGYAIYLDGKPIHHSDKPTRVVYDMTKK